MPTTNCDILIIGCGPTGVVLANLLGQQGCRIVLVEQTTKIHKAPRATHIDEETQRNFQATGLMDQLKPYMSPFGMMGILDHDGQVLLQENVQDPQSPHGYAQSCFFHQPDFERVLRAGLSRYPNVVLQSGVTAEQLTQNPDHVTVKAKQEGIDESLTIQAQWVIGCDGGRSFVRDSIGVKMESLAPRRPWVIIDTLLKNPDDATLLPSGFRYLLKKERLMLYAHGFGLNRRWEFQMRNDEPIPSESQIMEWVAQSIDPSKLEVLRIADYAHNSLVAEKWRVGRVLLAGDSAHMMPPSAGQGLCSGVRDAVNLAWKLGQVISGKDRSLALLDTYETERKPHVQKILKASLFISNTLKGDTPIQRWWRRQHILALSKIPWLHASARQKATPRPPLLNGCVQPQSPYRGQHLPQTQLIGNDGAAQWLDDAIGYQFALIARPGVLSKPELAWTECHGVKVRQLHNADQKLTNWFDTRKLDYAIARPDRFIFSAGEKKQFNDAQRELEQWLN